jgi:pimeloyl-ACP methyl ester carboxylesterase
VVFAASRPGRTRALVLADASVRYRCSDYYPAGWSDREIDERIEAVRNGGLVGSPQVMAPSLSEDLAFQRWFNRAGRLHCTPGDRVWRIESALNADLRAALGAVRVPTLVITHRGRPGVVSRSTSRLKSTGQSAWNFPAPTACPSRPTAWPRSTRSRNSSPGASPPSNSTGC